VHILNHETVSKIAPSEPRDSTLLFNSQKIPKLFGHDWNATSKIKVNADASHLENKERVLDMQQLRLFVETLRRRLGGLTFFGVDVIIESGPIPRHYVLDVNYFPGYIGEWCWTLVATAFPPPRV
jgi:hypothetical protein